VECAAIATRYLGPLFDVQAGGTDLVFPHHEMSASHARVALGDTTPVFARRYAHAGMVRLDGAKMSKSLGNLVFVSALLAEGTDPMAVRLAILAHRYRHDWDWTQPGLEAAVQRLARWRAAVSIASAGSSDSVPPGESVLAAVREHLADDLDAPGAIAVVDRWSDTVLAAVPATVPATAVPATAVPATAVPATAVPATAVPATAEPATAAPATAVPATAVPATAVPATAGAATAGGATTATGTTATAETSTTSAARLVRDTVDALLGIAL
jgi:cysteinyl-tRNA synthetase